MDNAWTLYIIRHAQSVNNAVPESQRIEDPPITSKGEQQVALLADRFRDEGITHALTSGFLRAVQTMRPLAEKAQVKPAIWTDLHEVGGCYRGHEVEKIEGAPGMDRQTLQLEFPEFEIPDDIGDDGWWRSRPFEKYQQAMSRAQDQAARLLDVFRRSQAKVACVIHADFKALLLEILLGDAYHEFAYADLMNTGVTILRCSEDDVSVESFNDTSHLPEELQSS